MPSTANNAIGKVSWQDRSTDTPTTGHCLILPNDAVLVGRDDARNHVAFADLAVSRSQLEIYSTAVDDECTHPPLVFIRDRGSANGTYVNGQHIGKRPELSPARLLEHGDIITIGLFPRVVLKYTQLLKPRCSYRLSHLQRQEFELFQDRYIITGRTIGDGGQAVVFLAIEVASRQHVACKVYDISRFPETSKERIRQEAELMSILDHPNILPIRAAFETRQTLYIMAELATGGDLYSLLLRHKKLEESLIRWIIRQVLRAVVYIHSKGVAHRDIKPENILCGVTPRTPSRIMLSDFGTAAVAGGGMMTRDTGTRPYRPPECYTPRGGHGLSADIWAVGMLSLQLFLGDGGFPNPDSMFFLSQGDVDTYLSSVFDRLSSRGLKASDAGKSFISGCLTFDPERRPTARQAFYHAWLQQPKEDRKLFKRLEADNALLWQRQPVKLPVIERLPAPTPGLEDTQAGIPPWESCPQQDTVSQHFPDRNKAAEDVWTDRWNARLMYRWHEIRHQIKHEIRTPVSDSAPPISPDPEQPPAKRRRVGFD